MLLMLLPQLSLLLLQLLLPRLLLLLLQLLLDLLLLLLLLLLDLLLLLLDLLLLLLLGPAVVVGAHPSSPSDTSRYVPSFGASSSRRHSQSPQPAPSSPALLALPWQLALQFGAVAFVAELLLVELVAISVHLLDLVFQLGDDALRRAQPA